MTDLLLTGWLVRGYAVHFGDCLWPELVAWRRATRFEVFLLCLCGIVVFLRVLASGAQVFEVLVFLINLLFLRDCNGLARL